MLTFPDEPLITVISKASGSQHSEDSGIGLPMNIDDRIPNTINRRKMEKDRNTASASQEAIIATPYIAS